MDELDNADAGIAIASVEGVRYLETRSPPGIWPVFDVAESWSFVDYVK
eukprot:CAMPEP_0113329468 /NCGR_PEP_ID=MMETSP0010_2-20120614/20925_1 /TAXON_ID=216773 ORGANISM="Corethron hystrix, Strain 308" /NCGR_SAMPLE_ID=MMETSP0010_2 /ASSEMBLY_ACC=CAM_ASM_000155 /LENGTH=47 /DNA_ID=CAMNT_0000191577 /DNA_START=1162 /DNA_END=1305 /DNA_ORIENTATION=- /assembly_acc=CAM_ASM_000155